MTGKDGKPQLGSVHENAVGDSSAARWPRSEARLGGVYHQGDCERHI